MPHDEFYDEMKKKAVNARQQPIAIPEIPYHGPEHVFFVGFCLFSLSILLFILLNIGEVEDSFLGLNNSTGKLVKGLVQLFSLQLLFLSLGIFYKSFMASVVKEKPDNFIERIIDFLKNNFDHEKDKKETKSTSINVNSTLWVSLVLAITVNVSVSISNYFEHLKPNNEVYNTLKEIKADIYQEREFYKGMQEKLTAELSRSGERLSTLEEQLVEQSNSHNAALGIIGEATSALNQSIKNFDGISVHNSFPGVSQNDEPGMLKIENKVNIDSPDNFTAISEIDRKIELANKKIELANEKNRETELLMRYNENNFLCLQHEGLISWTKQHFSNVERKSRQDCEDLKIELKKRLKMSKNLGADHLVLSAVTKP